MNIQECAADAVDKKENQGYNCCQAVVLALAGETDLPEEKLEQIGAGFAAGMGNMQGTCGALVGAGIIAGLKTEGSRTVRFARRISEAFRERSGAVICAELKGAGGGPVLCPCSECVRNAVLAYGEVMLQG